MGNEILGPRASGFGSFYQRALDAYSKASASYDKEVVDTVDIDGNHSKDLSLSNADDSSSNLSSAILGTSDDLRYRSASDDHRTSDNNRYQHRNSVQKNFSSLTDHAAKSFTDTLRQVKTNEKNISKVLSSGGKITALVHEINNTKYTLDLLAKVVSNVTTAFKNIINTPL